MSEVSDVREERESTRAGEARAPGRSRGFGRPFVLAVRVYHEDVDGLGIVYHANYMKFMERARTEWLRALGIEQATLREEHGLVFVVVDLEAHYRKPARYGELLQVTCVVRAATRASLTLEQQIYRGPVGEQLLVEGRVRAACLDAASYRPKPLPQALLEKIESGDQ